MFSQLRFLCAFCVFLGSLFTFAQADESYTITKKPFQFSHRIKVQAFAEKNESINNPVRWLSVNFLVDDGSKVEEGQMIAGFDETRAVRDLKSLNLKQDTTDAALAKQLMDIDNAELSLRDTLESLLDSLAVKEAELVFYKSMPNADDVSIAEGRHRVASLNFEAAQSNYRKGVDRFERKLISQAELDKFKRELDDKKVLLEYATNDLEYTKLSASSSTLERLGLEIKNLELEIGKVKNELSEQEALAEIQRDGAKTQKRNIERRIRDKEKDIDNTKVLSPISGFAKYNINSSREPLALGTQMWRGFEFMKIPDMNSLAFKGAVPESIVKHLAVGDRVEIVLNGRGDNTLDGQIRMISKLARDLAESDEVDFGDVGKEFGIKVNDITIELTGKQDWVKLGQKGYATLFSSTQTEQAAVPLRFVYFKEGSSYLSIDGVYQEVTGVVNQGYFFLGDDGLDGQRVGMSGRFASDIAQEELEANGYFSGTGEILPVRSSEVIVKKIGGWFKVKWLIEEESFVKKGDLVAEIDDTEINKRIEERENELNEAKRRLEEQSKRLELNDKEETFKLKKAEHLLEIAELNMNVALRALDYPKIFSETLSKEQIEIRLAGLQKQLANQESKERPTISPYELNRLKRNIEREKLKLERASINLKKTQSGTDIVSRSQAKLGFLEQQVEVAVMRRSIEYERLKNDFALKSDELNVRSNEIRLGRVQSRKDNLKVYASTDGFIRYNKIWNSGVIAKVNVGSQIGSRFGIMRIPDLSSMYLSVEVPEKYFQDVKPGLEVDVEIPSLDDTRLKGVVDRIDFLFENKERKDSKIGLYSSQEPLGEVIFKVKVNIIADDVQLKPGAIGVVRFPFAGS